MKQLFKFIDVFTGTKRPAKGIEPKSVDELKTVLLKVNGLRRSEPTELGDYILSGKEATIFLKIDELNHTLRALDKGARGDLLPLKKPLQKQVTDLGWIYKGVLEL